MLMAKSVSIHSVTMETIFKAERNFLPPPKKQVLGRGKKKENKILDSVRWIKVEDNCGRRTLKKKHFSKKKKYMADYL